MQVQMLCRAPFSITCNTKPKMINSQSNSVISHLSKTLFLVSFHFLGILHDDLKLFLQSNVKSGKKDKVTLGVSDSKLGASINEELGFSCQHTGIVIEIIRGM